MPYAKQRHVTTIHVPFEIQNEVLKIKGRRSCNEFYLQAIEEKIQREKLTK